MKQNVRFQERKHLEKFRLDQIQIAVIGHYSLSHGRYLVNRARSLDHYYKTKCHFSGEDAPWKFLALIEFKMANNRHYLPR